MTRVVDVSGRGVRVEGRGVSVGSAIPDSEVYLHDDWGDNKLTNRDGSDTVTYNGVQGVYRPEWTVQTPTVEAQNQQLELLDASDLHAPINLNLSEIITWSWSNVDVSQSSDVNNILALGLWASGTTFSSGYLSDGYCLAIRPNGSVSFRDKDTNGLISASTAPTDTSAVNIDIIRDPTVAGNPEFEVFIDGSSIGTAQTANDPASIDYLGIGRRNDEAGVVYSVDNFKVS